MQKLDRYITAPRGSKHACIYRGFSHVTENVGCGETDFPIKPIRTAIIQDPQAI
jgi:hypothetical protein